MFLATEYLLVLLWENDCSVNPVTHVRFMQFYFVVI